MSQEKNKILVDIAKKSTLLRRIYRKLAYGKRNLDFSKYEKKFKVDEKVILFEAYKGEKYTCNPKAIYEEIIKDSRFDDYILIWLFKEPENFQDMKALERAKLIATDSAECYEWYAKAKYIVTNSMATKVGRLRKEQIYIQTWHGTPLKRLGFDLYTEKGNSLNSLEEIGTRYSIEAKKISYMISPSKFTTEKLDSSFKLSQLNKKAEIVETGYPRNDYLINHKQEDIEKIKRKLGIRAEDKNKKIVLYAPTFRDNNHKSGVGYTYDLGFQIENLKKELKDNFIILFRTHYFIENSIDLSKHEDFIINATDYPEINDLYLAADLLITDYSSVFFDFATLKKPMVFYMYDLEEYRDDIRGFYLDIEELPGIITEKEEDLIEAIKGICRKEKNIEVERKYKAFNEKFNYLEDGKASKRAIEACIVKHTGQTAFAGVDSAGSCESVIAYTEKDI